MSGKRAFCALTVGLALVAAVFAGGFLHFAARVMSFQEPPQAHADGIVALTGGASRIADALELLSQGRGERLLITGVNPTTSDRVLAQRSPDKSELFACCVDLDYDALNTVGNAEETRKWVERTGFRSLIVVTSGYHIPRSMAELGRAMPEVTLIPYPVVSDNLKHENWWLNRATTRLLFQEYLKFVVAKARQSFSPASSSVSIAQAVRAPGL